MKKVIVQFNIPGLNTGLYDQCWDELRTVGQSDPDGLLYHFSGVQGNSFVVCDIWESIDKFNNFSKTHLLPIFRKLNIKEVQPVITDLYYEYEGVQAKAGVHR